MKEIKVSDWCVLVKIYDVDKEVKNTSVSGLITANMLKPAANNCGIGEAISIGNKVRWIKKGDIVLFSWLVEEQEERFLGRDETGEYRIVKDAMTGGQIYGIVKNNKRTGMSQIIPRKFYALCEPPDELLVRTDALFQIPITSLNPQDEAAKKMGIKAGDWIVCESYSPKPISLKRQIFWFIFLEDIVALNSGHHKLAIQQKYVSPLLRLSSRKNVVQLN